MGLSSSERKEIEEIVNVVMSVHMQRLLGEITNGFVEIMDWYTENLTKIVEASNQRGNTIVSEQVTRLIEDANRAPKRPVVKGFGK